MQLVHKVCSGKAELIQQFTQPSPSDVESITPAGHQVLVKGFWGSGCRGLVNQFSTYRGVECSRYLKGCECFAKVALRNSGECFNCSIAEFELLKFCDMNHLG